MDSMSSAPTAAFVPFVASTLRALARTIPDDVWRFFTLAAAHRDEMNILFPGVRAFMAFGYRAEEVEPLYEACLRYGLLRQLQARGRDAFGRWLPAVFQINPQVVHIDARRIDSAMRVGGVPFMPLPCEPDPGLRSIPDQAPDQAYANLRGNPDPGLRENSGSGSLGSKAESESRFNKQIPKGDPKGDPTKQNHAFTDENHGYSGASHASQTNAGKGQVQPSPPETVESARPTNQNPLSPVPGRPSPPGGALAPYYKALPTPTSEMAARVFQSTALDTRIEYARMYVDQFGYEIIMQAIERMQRTPDDKRREFKSRTAVMVSWCKQIQAERLQKAAAPVAGVDYDMSNPAECLMAAHDSEVTHEMRKIYQAAWNAFDDGSRAAALSAAAERWGTQDDIIWIESGTAQGDEVIASWIRTRKDTTK